MIPSERHSHLPSADHATGWALSSGTLTARCCPQEAPRSLQGLQHTDWSLGVTDPGESRAMSQGTVGPRMPRMLPHGLLPSLQDHLIPGCPTVGATLSCLGAQAGSMAGQGFLVPGLWGPLFLLALWGTGTTTASGRRPPKIGPGGGSVTFTALGTH